MWYDQADVANRAAGRDGRADQQTRRGKHSQAHPSNFDAEIEGIALAQHH